MSDVRRARRNRVTFLRRFGMRRLALRFWATSILGTPNAFLATLTRDDLEQLQFALADEWERRYGTEVAA